MGFLILAVFGALLVPPFIYGYIKGPDSPARVLEHERAERLYGPLQRIARIYGTFLVLYVIAETWRASDHISGYPTVCANTPYTTMGGGGSGVAVKAGASLQSNGAVQVCAAHPTASQWLLYALIRLPSLVVWAIVLLLVWQLIRQAARGGPFTRQSAAITQLLGLVILAGTAVAAALSALGSDLLGRMLLGPPTLGGGGIAVDVLIRAPLVALLPWPALVGAALLSFARITHVGADLDDEVRATV